MFGTCSFISLMLNLSHLNKVSCWLDGVQNLDDLRKIKVGEHKLYLGRYEGNNIYSNGHIRLIIKGTQLPDQLNLPNLPNTGPQREIDHSNGAFNLCEMDGV